MAAKRPLSQIDRNNLSEFITRALALIGKKSSALEQNFEDLLDLDHDLTNTFAVPGAATINKAAGIVAIAAGASTVVVTNNLVNANTIIVAVVMATDGTLLRVDRVVPGTGSFTITGNANATGNVKVGFLLVAGMTAPA